MKYFLSHVETKRKLTVYLSHKFIAVCEKVRKEYFVYEKERKAINNLEFLFAVRFQDNVYHRTPQLPYPL